MQVNDKEILKKNKEEIKKTMEDLASTLRRQNGFNMGDNRFDIRENSVGDYTLYIAPGVDLNNLPDGWKYEANYYLDSDYPKEGLWRMKDGKYEFLPIGHDLDKTRTATYTTPDDVINAVLSENPHITKDQVYYDRNGNIIKLTGVVNDLKMPQGLEMRGGKLVCINDPNGKEFEVEKVLANDTSKSDMRVGSNIDGYNNYGVQENIGQNPYQEDILSKHKTQTEQGATIEQYGRSIFDFNKMKYVNHNFIKNDRGEVITKNKDDNYKSFNTQDNNDPMIEATLELNEVWINAYMSVAGKSGKDDVKSDMAFEGENSAELFHNMMNAVEISPKRNLSDILFYLCEHDGEILAHTGFLKVMGVFLSEPRVAMALGIDNVKGVSIDAIIMGVDKMANQKLKDDAKGMMNALGMEGDGPVMEMNRKPY